MDRNMNLLEQNKSNAISSWNIIVCSVVIGDRMVIMAQLCEKKYLRDFRNFKMSIHTSQI